jgi:hypothetical protein
MLNLLFLKPVPHPVQRINHVERVVHLLGARA